MTSLELALRQIDQAFDRKSWHGTNLRGALRGLTHEQAAWRPAEGRNNIWELVLHSAYWKYTVRRRLGGGARSGFVLEGSNFFARPEPGRTTEQAWKADVEILVTEHRALRQTIASLSPQQLQTGADGKMAFVDLVIGIAAHDLYHAGQIQLLKRLQKGTG